MGLKNLDEGYKHAEMIKRKNGNSRRQAIHCKSCREGGDHYIFVPRRSNWSTVSNNSLDIDERSLDCSALLPKMILCNLERDRNRSTPEVAQ